VYAAQRVTQRAIADRSLHGLNGNLAAMGRIQEQLSSGRQVARPSDDPTGTVSALQIRSDMNRMSQWARNASDGLGWLGTIDNTLTGLQPAVRRARELVLQGMSTGNIDANARTAIAAEIEQLREHMLTFANTRYLDRPVFGGTTTSGTAYDAAGTFIGDANPVVRTVGANSRVRVDFTGPEIFEAGGASLFEVMAQIADHLRTNPGALEQDLARLDTLTANLHSRIADVGARYSRVEQARTRADDLHLELMTRVNEIESIDLPRAIMQLSLQRTAYEAALGATARVVQPSLMDFLR
jgi:flagellar hook-associated protein 3 FlgL